MTPGPLAKKRTNGRLMPAFFGRTPGEAVALPWTAKTSPRTRWHQRVALWPFPRKQASSVEADAW